MPRSAAARRVPRLGFAVREKGVQVPADGGGADPELLGDHDGGHGTLFQQQPGDLLTGLALGADLRRDVRVRGTRHVAARLVTRLRLFHNTSVSYFPADGKGGRGAQ